MHTSQTVKSVFCILLQSILYGIGNPLTKTAYGSVTPFWCLSFRFSVAFFIFLLFFGRSICRNLKGTHPLSYLPACLCMAIAYISCNLALSLTSATNVGFIMSLPVIFAPIFARILLKQKYDFQRLPFRLAVLLGLFLLCMNGGSFSFGLGDFFALVTAVSIAGSLVFGKKSLETQLHPITISAAQTGITAAISIICALLFDRISVIPEIKPSAWLIILYLALCCTCIAYVLQNLALSWSSPSLVSMLQCSQPILTALVAFLLLGETLSLTGMIGAGIILVCTGLESYYA